MSIEKLRNIGIVAHIDAGKTTISERILYYTGVERRMGEVHEGTATMDWMEEERRRGITITSAATSVPWRAHTINLIDTPGHVDFTVEVERCMRVLDGAVLVLNAVNGVQAQSETVWRQMRRHRVAALAFVNQLDRPGADFLGAVRDLRERLGAPAIPIQFPVGSGREARAVVDLIRGVCLRFPEGDKGRRAPEGPVQEAVPEELADEVGVLRSELIDALADDDEELFACVLEEREPDEAALVRALREAVASGRLLPVLCGAALRNVGVQPLLDAIVDYLPSPAERPAVRGLSPQDGTELERPPVADGPLCALVFKLMADANEDLLFTRIYSGSLRPGQKVFNPRVGRMERIARVLRMHADARQPLEEAGPGEIVALSGLKMSATGDSLGGHDDAVLLERPSFADPVITRVVEPRATGDREKLRQALERLAFEDPSFHPKEDEETGQWRIAGMGELHLEIKEHRLRDEFGLEVTVGQPRVAYREAPTVAARAEARIDRQLGGARVVKEVGLEMFAIDTEGATRSEAGGGSQERGAQQDESDAPGDAPGDGQNDDRSDDRNAERIEWSSEVALHESLRPALEDALSHGLSVGPRFGYPVMGARLRIVSASGEVGADGEAGLVQAAGQALRQALAAAEVVLVEPVMEFEIESPAEFMSGVIAALNAKRAAIRDLSAEEGVRAVRGRVPLFEMFGFATTLRSLSQGRAHFTLSPAGFRRVPEDVLEARGMVWH